MIKWTNMVEFAMISYTKGQYIVFNIPAYSICILICDFIFSFSPALVLPFYSINYVQLFVLA